MELFQALTPVPDVEIRQTIAQALMGVAAAVAVEDFEGFTTALEAIQRVGFKAREIAAQDPCVADLMQALSAAGPCGVGMSSMGPLVFAITFEENRRLRQELVSVAARNGAEILGEGIGLMNKGYDLK